MSYPFGQAVYRLRAGLKLDPYSQEQMRGDWGHPELLRLDGAFIAQTSTGLLGDATRSQAAESRSLFGDPDADVAKDDRIFVGTFAPALPDDATTLPDNTVMTGETYTVDGIPAANVNPFTGWTPVREIPLTRSVG